VTAGPRKKGERIEIKIAFEYERQIQSFRGTN